MLDTFSSIWGKVLLRCPSIGPLLAQDFVTNAFREIVERRRWSWLLKQGQFLCPALYNTGVVNVTRGSNLVQGVGTAWTPAMNGTQFRVGTNNPIYTITAVTDAMDLVIDQVWGGSTVSGAGYMIYQCYYPVPTDFHAFTAVIDPNFNWRLWTLTTNEEINNVDAQRGYTGQAYVVATFDYNYWDPTAIPPVPRYEIWPHQTAQYVYPFMYECRPPDLQDPGASLPRFITGNVLLEKALADCAKWPGPSGDKPNPYFNLRLAAMHDEKFDYQIAECEVQDSETYSHDLFYDYNNLSFAAWPFSDADWLQSHAPGP